jgi:hypothetical protein
MVGVGYEGGMKGRGQRRNVTTTALTLIGKGGISLQISRVIFKNKRRKPNQKTLIKRAEQPFRSEIFITNIFY